MGLLWGGFALGVFLTLSVSASSFDLNIPESCERLSIQAVDLVGSAEKKVSCPREVKSKNKLACHELEGFSKFEKRTLAEGKEALEIKLSENYDERLSLISLTRSRAIQEMDRFIILARKISGARRICEPHFIYAGKRPVFQLGPVFLNGQRIAIGENIYSNLILSEGADVPLMKSSMLSQESLERNHYYDIVMAHEMAHGLMQDLYGVDELGELEKHSFSRDGHFASATTDPALAWIEGFAEGFEAFLGEKYLTTRQLETPLIDEQLQSMANRLQSYEQAERKAPAYIWAVIEGIAQGAVLLRNIDDFMAQFVKAERQRAIRDNHYILPGRMANLLDYYELSEGDSESESADVIYSKEGVIGHFIYLCLKNGLEAPLFSSVHKNKPLNFYQFLKGFLPQLSEEQRKLLQPTLLTLFSKDAKFAAEVRMRSIIEARRKLSGAAFDAELIAIEEFFKFKLAHSLSPMILQEPQENLWIEFETTALLKKKLMGKLDRLNLATASQSRLIEFLKTVTFSHGVSIPPAHQQEISLFIVKMRESLPERAPPEFIYAALERARRSNEKPGGYALAFSFHLTAEKLKEARACFLNRCETPVIH